ncbi:7865_t:CDS:1, partial [Acaulospora colombiana]
SYNDVNVWWPNIGTLIGATVYGTSTNGSASTDAGSSNRSSTDGSTRRTAKDVQGVVRLFVLAICMTWFM